MTLLKVQQNGHQCIPLVHKLYRLTKNQNHNRFIETRDLRLRSWTILKGPISSSLVNIGNKTHSITVYYSIWKKP